MRLLTSIALLAVIPALLTAARTHETNPMSSPEDFEEGRRLYRINCGVCHGMEGKTGRGARLARRSYRHGNSDAALFDLIEGGVPGTDMPGLWLDERTTSGESSCSSARSRKRPTRSATRAATWPPESASSTRRVRALPATPSEVAAAGLARTCRSRGCSTPTSNCAMRCWSPSRRSGRPLRDRETCHSGRRTASRVS